MFAKSSPTLTLAIGLALVISTLATGAALAAPAPSPTLNVTLPSGGDVTSGANYVVSGCGYASTGVTVVVHSPEAISFAGQMPDSNGCISVSNFYTQGSGHYELDAFQQIHGGSKESLVASTSFDLT